MNDVFEQVSRACAELEESSARMREVLRSGERILVTKRVRSVANGEQLNDFCEQAKFELGVSVCLVTLIDLQRQVFLGSAGSLDPDLIREGTEVEESLCQYVVASGRPLQVDSADLFCSTIPGIEIKEAGMHAYYGEPITVEGQVVGSFCALDDEPHHWTAPERSVVKNWAARVGRTFEEALA